MKLDLKTLFHILFTALIFCSTAGLRAGTLYWVGGSGSWSDVSHWSKTSGGSGGVSVPTLNDDVIVDSNSFLSSGKIIIDENFLVNSLRSTPAVEVTIFSDVDVVGLIDKQWFLNGLTTNNIQGAVNQINRQNQRSYKYFGLHEFHGVRGNFLNKDAIGEMQLLQVTTVNFTIVESTCPNAPNSCNGTVTAIPVDGTGAFSYQWFLQPGSAVNGDVQTATGVCVGPQTVVITDLSDPVGTQPYINTVALEFINVGPAPFASGIISSIPETCPGANDGQLIAFASGGTAPYNFSWSPSGGGSLNATNLAPGPYTLSIIDVRGCVFSDPPAGIVGPAPVLTVIITPDQIPVCGGPICTEDVVFTIDSVANGNGPPFLWSNRTDSTDMCPGDVYTSTVTDALGCPTIATHTAAIIPPIVITTTELDTVTCLGVFDGAGSASASGGTVPYVYNWLNIPPTATVNATGDTVTSLPAGTYTVEVTDANLCVQTETVTITSPTPQVVIANASISDSITCLLALNGEAAANGSGGTPGYIYNWFDAPGTVTFNAAGDTVRGLPNGTFNVEVKDQDGCVDTAQVIVTAPIVNPVTATATLTDTITCLTATNGGAIANGAGGTPGYDFDWYDVPGAPIITQSVGVLPIGTYNVGVTDQDGCADTAQIVIAPLLPNPVIANASVTTPVTCLASGDGVALASGSGGTPGYDFDWYDVPGAPVVTASASSLPLGTYNVGVTDQDGCADTAQVVVVLTTTPMVASISAFTPAVCLGLPTGDATAGGTGGNPVYIFKWYDVPGAPIFTQQVSTLPVGVYNVEVKDQVGCADTAQVTIIAVPPVITTALNPVQPNCDGVTCDGSITASSTGGTNPYVYEWFGFPGGPVAGQNLSNLCAGTYNVAVVDSNGCRDTVTQVFIPPMTISLVSKTDIVCGGACAGVINVVGAGGTGTYVYNWYDMTGTPTANAANDSMYGVCGGTYNIEVSDGTGAGCLDTLQVTIAQPPSMVIWNSNVNNICFGDCNGTIVIDSITGGALPVVSLWTDSTGVGPISPQLLNLSGLCNGTYTYEATDNDGCVVTKPITITSPQTSVSFIISPLCPTDLVANVQATAGGGSPGYVYTWLTPVTGNVNNKLQIGLLPGSYDLEVVDVNGCTDTFTLTFAIPLPIISTSIVTDAKCQGICDGAINVSISQGTGPYQTTWYDMVGTPTTEDVTNVCAGAYSLEIEDANGCKDTLKTVLVDTIMSIATTVDSLEATCNGLCDGKVWVTASNGIPNYTYNWYDVPVGNAVQDTAFNMCVGSYNVEIIDQQGCIDTVVATVTAPVVVAGNFINTTQNICAQDCNGTTEISVTGGVGPVNVMWLNITTGNPTSPVVSNLCNGSYRVEVSDVNGCKDLDTIDITSQSGTVTFVTVDPSCGGYNDGSITATVVGGPGPPIPPVSQFVWLNIVGNPNSNLVSGLVQGTYNLEMTDLNNCIDTFPVTITDPFPAIDLQTDSQVVSCFGLCDGKAWATPTGGSAPFFYDWYAPLGIQNSMPDTAINLCVGTYFVAVLDANNCEDTASVTITDPFVISLSSTSKPPCFGVSDGTANTVVTGEVRPFSYAWDNGILSTDSAVTNLLAGTYTVTVTNATGCSNTASVKLVENTQITAILDTTKATCTNFTNGSASIIPVGGVLPYQYLWTNGAAYTSVIPNPIDLAIGKYYVVVSDNIGCFYRDSVTISEIYAVLPDAGPDALLCEGDSATLVGSGGVSYLWTTGDISSTIKVSPEVTTTYTLTVTNNLCTDDDKVTVTVNLDPTAIVTADKNTLLEGFNMSTTIRGDGAGTGGTYDWTPPTGLSDPTNATPSVSPLVSTRYYLTVTDANGCKDTSSVLISIIESIEYPDGVSPNGDGLNDTWPIIFIENFPDAIVEIYNRWGQMLFHSVGYQDRWDGTFDGKTLPVGTYYFVIDLGTDLPKYTGPITIFR